jgi:hypothetical protein
MCSLASEPRSEEEQGSEYKPVRGRPPIKLSWASIEPYFCRPQPEAAKALGISLTSLKVVCRKQGLLKWPYRRIQPGKGKGWMRAAAASGKECNEHAVARREAAVKVKDKRTDLQPAMVPQALGASEILKPIPLKPAGT